MSRLDRDWWEWWDYALWGVAIVTEIVFWILITYLIFISDIIPRLWKILT
jgi:hypothetical protein